MCACRKKEKEVKGIQPKVNSIRPQVGRIHRKSNLYKCIHTSVCLLNNHTKTAGQKLAKLEGTSEME